MYVGKLIFSIPISKLSKQLQWNINEIINQNYSKNQQLTYEIPTSYWSLTQ